MAAPAEPARVSTSDVSVIIVNWHSEAMVAAALSALEKQTLAPQQVIVADNGGGAGMPLDRYTRSPIAILPMAGNAGFAAANNRAIAETVRTAWVALLNPDALPEPDWLEHLMRAAASRPDVAAFGSRQFVGRDRAVIDGLGDVYHVSGAAWRDGHGQPAAGLAPRAGEIFAPCAAAALYRRDALLEAGGFDEDFFCYFEDVDLGFRLRLLGHRSLLVPEAVVYHQGGATSGGKRSDFSVFHGQRNLVWSYVKNMPGPYFWLYLPQHVLFNLFSVLRYALRGQGGVALRAKWRALCGLPAMLRKRRGIQAGRRARGSEVRAAMRSGWLAPYRRGLASLFE